MSSLLRYNTPINVRYRLYKMQCSQFSQVKKSSCEEREKLHSASNWQENCLIFLLKTCWNSQKWLLYRKKKSRNGTASGRLLHLPNFSCSQEFIFMITPVRNIAGIFSDMYFFIERSLILIWSMLHHCQYKL